MYNEKKISLKMYHMSIFLNEMPQAPQNNPIRNTFGPVGKAGYKLRSRLS